MESNVNKIITNFVLTRFHPSRVRCIIQYGSSLNESGIKPVDHDFLVLLDTYQAEDLIFIREVSKLGKIDLFLDYEDQIIRKGIHNYQRGRHGSFFFMVLAHGHTLFGDNFYNININFIDKAVVDRDLLFRIEEYFYRIQKIYLSEMNDSQKTDESLKYISRICMDILIFKKKLKFSDIHTLHYNQIPPLFIKKMTSIEPALFKRMKDKLKFQNIVDIPTLLKDLYAVYLICFDEYNRKHNETKHL